MPTSFSTNLALALPATGELSGTWGSTVNSNITNMLDEALGYQAFSATGGSDTLTIPDGTTGVARSIYIQLNGTGGGTVNVPTTKTKMYFVFNNTASAITFKVTGQTGVSIPAAAKIALVSNGTDIITAENYFSALTLGAALPVASGGTALTSGTSGGVLAYTASGTLASSGALTQYGVVIGGGAGAVPTSTAAGTTTTVLHGNASGTPTFGAVSLTADVSGTLPAANGGTGVANNAASTLTISGSFASNFTVSGAYTYTFPGQTSSLGYLNIPQVGSAKTTSYSLVIGDVGKFVVLGTSGTIVIPASVFAAGDVISIVNNTTAGISNTSSAITAYLGGTNTVVTSFTLASRGVCTVLFVTASVVFITGNVA